jgi:hypothetical protein
VQAPASPAVSPAALVELHKLVGAEIALDAYHGALRRGTQAAARLASCGAVLVTCSDEFQGELRNHFERDVARPLCSGSIVGQRNVFALSNMAGRLEAGALDLALQHFSARNASGERTIVVEIMAHCGVVHSKSARSYGRVDRFGASSECCGALARMLEGSDELEAVHHPWHEQLTAFFGEERLAALRAHDPATRLLATAITHAVLQGESGVAEVLRARCAQATHVLIACGVVLNRGGADTVLPVALHHLRAERGDVDVVHGVSLRSTADAMRFEHRAGRLTVLTDEHVESVGPRRAQLESRAEFVTQVRLLHSASDEFAAARAKLAREQLEATRRRVERIKAHPQVWRVYARPLLRGLMQTLGVLAPEFGLVAMLVQSGHDAARAQRLRRLLERGPSSDEARRVLQEIEAEIQQLGHRDAQEVLDLLLGDRSPLLI